MPPIPFANCNAAPISPARMSKKHEPGLLLHWEPAVQTWRVDDCLPDGCMPRSVSWPRVFQRNRKVSFLHGTLQWGLLVVTCELRIALALLFLAHSHIGGVALCSCSLKAGSPIFFFFCPFLKSFSRIAAVVQSPTIDGFSSLHGMKQTPDLVYYICLAATETNTRCQHAV
jgi:hypothetical protein